MFRLTDDISLLRSWRNLCGTRAINISSPGDWGDLAIKRVLTKGVESWQKL